MGYNISALEGRNHGKDWPLIVMSVPCPMCRAEVGEKCHRLGSRSDGQNPFVNSGEERNDWHAERKQLAAHAWYEGRNENIPDDQIAQKIANTLEKSAEEAVAVPTTSTDVEESAMEAEGAPTLPPDADADEKK